MCEQTEIGRVDHGPRDLGTRAKDEAMTSSLRVLVRNVCENTVQRQQLKANEGPGLIAQGIPPIKELEEQQAISSIRNEGKRDRKTSCSGSS